MVVSRNVLRFQRLTKEMAAGGLGANKALFLQPRNGEFDQLVNSANPANRMRGHGRTRKKRFPVGPIRGPREGPGLTESVLRAKGCAMSQSIATIALVVADYDQAIAFYRDALGFALLADTDLGGGKRWVLVGPQGGGARLLLAQAGDEAERARIGDQTGGRVGFFLETDDFARDFEAFSARGVKFLETPRHEVYGSVAVFQDLCGNKWDLIEPKG